ncbi:D-ribose pyranase [Gorillibacterium sp. sgz5001074]|uniref:D-ribose pyranase n=1 Tax=Gorillibacterium sp. sgz5001074 TaxID=3446695 RepID=UPI003F67BB52
MKKGGILHPQLSRVLAETGHTDLIAVSDRGFPVPEGIERVDLGLVSGIPTVADVLQAIDAEFIIDTVILTHEMEEASPERYRELTEGYPHIHFKRVPHQEFKQMCLEARAVVKTGDAVPYANIIIVSG